MLSYPFSIFYYEIEKRKTKGRYITPGTITFYNLIDLNNEVIAKITL